MKIAVLGSGEVGRVLAEGFLRYGHEIMRASRTPGKLEPWRSANKGARTGDFAQGAGFAEVVVLAVKGLAAEEAVREAGNLDGKIVVDACNPIAEAPPVNGVLRFFTSLDESLMERLQRQAPRARFVKAFNSVGSALMVSPDLPGKPTMFICGNDAGAKTVVSGLLDSFGWEAEDMGGVEAARAIEPLCMLWCIPGFLRNDWLHAFKMLR